LDRGGRFAGLRCCEIATGKPPIKPLRIRMRYDGVKLAVPPDLSSMTTYVLLEQEAWLEKEPAAMARPRSPLRA
jgi:hypothetical protein